ncbi:MAG TPA: TonB-dependent receptor [Noviherbaspirillum sp.]|nr:TonB-dependent receptor [Noviherbaspirillum sp.]
MAIQHPFMAGAVLSALASSSLVALAQTEEKTLSAVVVTATPFSSEETMQILTPAKVLGGNELRNRLGASLGETLSHELGVSASGFGAGASRPIIRGLEGPRVKILQDGMAVSDLSALSNDHAVATEASTARQIEVLRGPAALLYGSGAIGGLINVVNERIPTTFVPQATGETELRLGTADRERSLSFSADGSAGGLALHVDGNARNADDYKIPGSATRNDPDSASGRLPSSFARARNLGFGAAHIADWGHIGASVGNMDNRYGIPTEERSYIEQSQVRTDVDGLIKRPFSGAESFRFRLGNTDYRHTENEADGAPAMRFKNKALETRAEIAHEPLAGWEGIFGMQTEHSRFSALSAETGRPDAVPVTKSSSVAAFLVEQRDFGPVRASAGVRTESVRRRPDDDGLPDRDFNLHSYSVGGLWTFAPGYGLGATFSSAQRAPAIEELYANGPHESTATFDIGAPYLKKEISRNVELTLQKTDGKLRWKANLFENRVSNFVFGRTDGSSVDESGNDDPTEEFMRRFWSQVKAKIHGAEAEASYNLRGEGMSFRFFADTSRGRLEDGSNLPLQPATRFGAETGYRQGAWRSGLSAVHARRQDRLATFETFSAPSYTLVDAHVSFTTRSADMQWTWFALVKNLLDEDVSLSTSILRSVAPQPGRNLVVGVRTTF